MCICSTLLYGIHEADDHQYLKPSRGILDFPEKQSLVWTLPFLYRLLLTRIVLIVFGSFIGVQFLKVIFQGIRASELKNTKDENEQLIPDVGRK